ncbi:competence protein ComFA [Paenibacillus phyllosphaerae]|uniref:Competence protein ComFA n=1 Tax=Paenibacillus phyllosphaerae TaxID=274593 RepID=A0A7W5FMP9_9BACL|nr:helicase-related protein [Paenibacillus phyllosphaerae]MBB3110501.1 competence protein ComFA [Paenibacillus phyllosphaerae]
MLAYVYVVVEENVTRSGWTIAPEIDLAWWLDDTFRKATVHAAGQERASMGQPSAGRFVLMWDEPLPLDEAIEAAASLVQGNDRLKSEEIAGKLAASVQAKKLKQTDSERNGRGLGKLIGTARGAAVPMVFGNPSVQRLGTGQAVAWYGEASREAESCLLDGRHKGKSIDWRKYAPAQSYEQAVRLVNRACMIAVKLQGRGLLEGEAAAMLGEPDLATVLEALQLAALLGQLRLDRAVAPAPQPTGRWFSPTGRRGKARALRCERCGSGEPQLLRTACAACGRAACAYCEACLTMGRTRQCGLLILGMPQQLPVATHGAVATSASMAATLAPWKLSPAQAAAAEAALRFIAGERPQTRPPAWARLLPLRRSPAPRGTASVVPAQGRSSTTDAAPRWLRLPSLPPSERSDHRQPLRTSPTPPLRFLLWAVTGAGKTEMIFPLIAAALASGGRALIATPRRDVVLELDPRIRRAFPNETVVTLYGGSEQRWESGGITISTTHQLLRFREAFELVVIDEIDAFPYHNDEMLSFAAERVCKQGGVTVLLSATPPAQLRSEAKRGQLPYVQVPVRFHRHPLPVPRLLNCMPVKQLIQRRKAPLHLIRALRESIDRGAQLFVFVQQIKHVDPLVEQLRRAFPRITVEGTSSKDEARTEKVRRFRSCEIRLLVTTTILERGVTVPRSDVFILDADGRLFDDASLIQMAGRAGRSKDDPAGRVYFCSPSRNQAQQSAVRQIKAMNRLAGKRGYLMERTDRSTRFRRQGGH